MSETDNKTLKYQVDGPEDAPVLILGPSLGTTWHRSAEPSRWSLTVQAVHKVPGQSAERRTRPVSP